MFHTLRTTLSHPLPTILQLITAMAVAHNKGMAIHPPRQR